MQAVSGIFGDKSNTGFRPSATALRSFWIAFSLAIPFQSSGLLSSPASISAPPAILHPLCAFVSASFVFFCLFRFHPVSSTALLLWSPKLRVVQYVLGFFGNNSRWHVAVFASFSLHVCRIRQKHVSLLLLQELHRCAPCPAQWKFGISAQLFCLQFQAKVYTALFWLRPRRIVVLLFLLRYLFLVSYLWIM